MKKQQIGRTNKQYTRKYAMRSIIIQHDPTITAVEYMEEPVPDALGIWYSQVILYRVGNGRGPERVEVAVNLETQMVVSLEPRKTNGEGASNEPG